MKTPTINEMKLLVARLLPDEIEVRPDYFTAGTPAFFWRNDGGGPETLCGQYIRETEWLHVCHLAEKTLTLPELHEYCLLMTYSIWPVGWQDWNDTRQLIQVSPEQRILNLCRVKHPELFVE